MKARRVNYRGWPNCYQLSNGQVDLIVTTDVGPRIIRFGSLGEENEFAEFKHELGKRGGPKWRLYGGHRLWHAPEAGPRTYFPDNSPAQLEHHRDFMRLVQGTESTTGIQKEMDIRLHPKKPQVQVTHRLRNNGLWAVDLAVWALTAMNAGGRAIIPLPPRGSHPKDLPPSSTLTLWAYTNLSDPRWTWGRQYVMLRQDSTAKKPQKIGAMAPDGWVAYARARRLFVKTFRHVAGAAYTDFGCSVETFTNDVMLEVETLGPLVRLEPGATVEHVEHWFLFHDVPVPTSEVEVDKHVLPKVEAARAST